MCGSRICKNRGPACKGYVDPTNDCVFGINLLLVCSAFKVMDPANFERTQGMWTDLRYQSDPALKCQ